MSELTNGLVGTAGEYYVAAELSKRGFIATITNKNTERIDILAARLGSENAVKIQVKATRNAKARWMLSKKAEQYFSADFFYVFVRLGRIGQRPDFHVVPSKIVAEQVRKSHQEWLRGGTSRKDSSIRNFWDEAGNFREKWELLEAD